MYERSIIMNYIVADYGSLPFSNYFIFAKVLQNNEHLCRRLLEIILDLPIAEITYIDREKDMKNAVDSRGIRLDVWVRTADGAVYDCEMQSYSEKNIPLRSRYYHSMIDLDMIEKGLTVSELKKSFVIFVCKDDYLEGGLGKYTFRKFCEQKKELLFNDNECTIVVNPNGDNSGMSDELKRFLEYISSGIPTDEFTRQL